MVFAGVCDISIPEVDELTFHRSFYFRSLPAKLAQTHMVVGFTCKMSQNIGDPCIGMYVHDSFPGISLTLIVHAGLGWLLHYCNKYKDVCLLLLSPDLYVSNFISAVIDTNSI